MHLKKKLFTEYTAGNKFRQADAAKDAAPAAKGVSTLAGVVQVTKESLSSMKVSFVIPANNEEKYIGRCLASIRSLEVPGDTEVEVVVVLNRCTDHTESIAKSYSAKIVVNDNKNLSSIRNSGIRASTGDWVITVDADSWVSRNTLAEVRKHIDQGDNVGGGISMRPERWSLGIAVGYSMVALPAFMSGVSFGLYWFHRSYFESIGGFDESKLIAEDIDFYKRLVKYGRSIGKKHVKVKKAFLTTSCRKFDEFGDWYFLKIYSNPVQVAKAVNGNDKKFLAKYWYDVKR